MAISEPMPQHPFTLRQLQYVVAVADVLSFRRAAERCRVSQPSLSAQIRQVEEQLGVALFERGRRRVLPTAAGAQLVVRARRLLADADDLTLESRRASDPLAGTLRIGVIPTISPYLLPAITPAVRAAYARLTTLWVEDKTANLVRALEAGALDAALLALVDDLGEVEHETIARDPFVLATRHDDPLALKKEPARPAELKDVPVLLLDDGHCLREQALAFCSRAKAQELEFRATSLATLAQMVAGGLGVTLLPRLAISTEAVRAGLHLRAFAEPAPHRTIVLVWRRHSPLGTDLRRLAATFRDAYPGDLSADQFPERQPPAKRRGTHRRSGPAKSR
jgi:LysR family hydrogen peroxide-inducible transcriptional activator